MDIISYNGIWTIFPKEKDFVFNENGICFGLVDIKPSTDIGKVIVETSVGQKHQCLLFNYNEVQNSLRLKSVCSSRTLFIKKWNSLKGEILNTRTKDKIESHNMRDVIIGDDETVCLGKGSTSISNNQSIELSNENTDEEEEPVIENAANISVQELEVDIDLPEYLCKDKTESNLIGDCVPVNVFNLVQPHSNRLARKLDTKHVNALKELYRSHNTCFTILLGNYIQRTDSSGVEVDFLSESQCLVETLGGNHTRVALQELLSEGYDIPQAVNVKLYKNLSNEEALKLSLIHNEGNAYSKPMTTVDMLELFRNELLVILKKEGVNKVETRISQKCLKLWKDRMLTILRLNSYTELHNKHKTVLSLSKSADDVWTMIQTILRMWKEKELKNTPRGDIKVFHLSSMSAATVENQKTVLADLIRSRDWKILTKSNCEFEEKSQKSSAKNQHKKSPEMSISVQEGNIKLQESVKSLQMRVNEKEADLKEARRKIDSLQNQIKQLNDKIEELKGEAFLKDTQIKELADSVQAYMYKMAEFQESAVLSKDIRTRDNETDTGNDTVHENGILPGNDKVPVNQDTIENKRKKEKERSGATQIKKKKTTTERQSLRSASISCSTENEYKKGDLIMAYWRQNQTWYPAKVLMKKPLGYSIQYQLDDYVETIPVSFMKRNDQEQSFINE